jgi:hypothetical protein
LIPVGKIIQNVKSIPNNVAFTRDKEYKIAKKAIFLFGDMFIYFIAFKTQNKEEVGIWKKGCIVNINRQSKQISANYCMKWLW